MITDLSTIAFDAFYELVNADVRDTLDGEIARLLRNPENADRWYDCLLHMKRSVEAQMTTKRAETAERRAECLGLDDDMAWLQYQAEIAKWKQGAVRFRNGVEDKIAEVKAIRRARRYEMFRTELTRVRQAIIVHRDTVNDNPDDTEAADLALWSLVD